MSCWTDPINAGTHPFQTHLEYFLEGCTLVCVSLCDCAWPDGLVRVEHKQGLAWIVSLASGVSNGRLCCSCVTVTALDLRASRDNKYIAFLLLSSSLTGEVSAGVALLTARRIYSWLSRLFCCNVTRYVTAGRTRRQRQNISSLNGLHS